MGFSVRCSSLSLAELLHLLLMAYMSLDPSRPLLEAAHALSKNNLAECTQIAFGMLVTAQIRDGRGTIWRDQK